MFLFSTNQHRPPRHLPTQEAPELRLRTTDIPSTGRRSFGAATSRQIAQTGQGSRPTEGCRTKEPQPSGISSHTAATHNKIDGGGSTSDRQTVSSPSTAMPYNHHHPRTSLNLPPLPVMVSLISSHRTGIVAAIRTPPVHHLLTNLGLTHKLGPPM
ncbi:hypothetical protein PGT21_013923 [Puccinia graminis f. sp. tritici]|uniref:Uncharacterized protein n=1 Tax=Puccinia graminis f. sp. tritici TaxID=56615 RepID=A0A5B0RII6_PUCGR|nr:hypothetical protein PGT21_013923 [Puccinia graminis f. sp. tritici]KAA1124753.1 hypothetical protein PGTUg99_033819 [Puccinia graminis f. sp. tritici]